MLSPTTKARHPGNSSILEKRRWLASGPDRIVESISGEALIKRVYEKGVLGRAEASLKALEKSAVSPVPESSRIRAFTASLSAGPFIVPEKTTVDVVQALQTVTLSPFTSNWSIRPLIHVIISPFTAVKEEDPSIIKFTLMGARSVPNNGERQKTAKIAAISIPVFFMPNISIFWENWLDYILKYFT